MPLLFLSFGYVINPCFQFEQTGLRIRQSCLQGNRLDGKNVRAEGLAPNRVGMETDSVKLGK